MIAIFLHIYWVETLNSLLKRLKDVPFKFNLYVNLVENFSDKVSQDILNQYPTAKINISPNQGMDPGGQLRTLKYWLSNGQDEEFLIFIHSKKDNECRECMSSIISPKKALNAINKFKDSQVGMIGVKEWHLDSSFTDSQSLQYSMPICCCEFYCNWLKLNNFETKRYGFIGGTMFWVRAKIYKDLFKDFPILDLVQELEPYATGGKIHALERIFGYIVLSAGYRIEGV